MSAIRFNSLMSFEVEYCCSCGMPMALESNFRAQRLQDGKQFHCANGHGQAYTDNENSRLKKQVEQERKQKEWAQQATAKANAERDEAIKSRAKIQKRTAHGVCPCCNRTFKQLAAHMKAKHPKFQEVK